MPSPATRPASITPTAAPRVGPLLRSWRERRRMSQLDLASAASVSTRHLSYVETGRSTPSRELIVHLAGHLDVPHREQNDLLLAAGYAPAYVELDLHDPAMRPVVSTLETMLAASEPNPALVMDRHWNLLLANDSALAWTELVDPALLELPTNVLRLTVHPDGLGGSLVNRDEVISHLLARVRRQIAVTGDAALGALLDEMERLAPDAASVTPIHAGHASPAVAVRIRSGGVERG